MGRKKNEHLHLNFRNSNIMVRVFPNKNIMFYIVVKILGNENILF